MQGSNQLEYQAGGEMGAGAPAQPGLPPPLPGGYRFSAEELRVLRECNSESFFQRCVPIATALGLGTYYAVNSGYLRGNPRFGAAPKMTLAVIIGYFAGKLSYQQACAEKLMALPNSYVGQLLKDKKEGRVTAPLPAQPGSLLGVTPAPYYSDAGPGSSLDLDITTPIFSEDTYRSEDQVRPQLGGDLAPPEPHLSYEELRRQNRTLYNNTKQDPYRMDPDLVPPLSRGRAAPPAPAPARPSTNQYGDEME